MHVRELNYDDQCTCSRDKFCSFVAQSGDFSAVETAHLQQVILNKKLSAILYISATLAIWSMTAAWVDAVILPFIILYTVSFPGASYYPLLFPVIWTLLNAGLKFTFIRQRLGDAITVSDNFLAVLPYAGAAFLLKNWFVGDPLLRKAAASFIVYQKKLVTKRVFGFLPWK